MDMSDKDDDTGNRENNSGDGARKGSDVSASRPNLQAPGRGSEPTSSPPIHTVRFGSFGTPTSAPPRLWSDRVDSDDAA